MNLKPGYEDSFKLHRPGKDCAQSPCPTCGHTATYEKPVTSVARHKNSARFHALLAEAGRMHDKKQADYGRTDDPFANVRASEEWGIPGWVGAMVRLNDKVRRLQALAQNGRLSNESASDSFMDIAVYALIAHVLYEQE